MANNEQVSLLKSGVEAWNDWRHNNPGIRPDLKEIVLIRMETLPDMPESVVIKRWDLRGFDLSEADLSGANLTLVNLEGADLRSADLFQSNLNKANLNGAKLEGANLRGATLREAQAKGANFFRADLSSADLTEADLTEAKLFQARVHHSILKNAVLRKAEFLDAQCRLSDFSGAKLHDANFFHATVDQCDFAEAEMPGARFNQAQCIRSNFSFVKAPGADFGDRASLTGSAFVGADLSGARLNWSILEGALLIRTDLRGSDLSHSRTYGASVWEVVIDEKTVQHALPTTSYEDEVETRIYVDDIEVANFIHMLRDHKKLGKIINALTSRFVLLLGPFKDGGLDRLRALADSLKKADLISQEYWPVIFDFDQPEDRNLEEAAKILVGLSKFVIADLGGPSVPHELAVYVRSFRVPFVPIIQEGRTPYSLLESLEEEANVLPLVQYIDTNDLLQLVPLRIIAPAEAKYKERQQWLKRKR
jgi:uncharacterized protein YjbI with pentapeptide repeats